MFRYKLWLQCIGRWKHLPGSLMTSDLHVDARTSRQLTEQRHVDQLHVPKDLTLARFLFKNADGYSKKTALIDDTTGTRVSFEQLQTEIRTLTSAFNHLGLSAGDVVTLHGLNTPYVVHVLSSVTDNGAALSLASSQLTPDELASQLRQTASKFVISTPDCAETAIQASFLSPYTQEVISTGKVSGCRSILSMLDTERYTQYPKVHINPDSTTALIPFSSGTTGLPKGVKLTHTNIIAELCQLRHPRFLSMTDDCDLSLCTLPTVHIAGLVISVCLPLLQGATVVIQPRFCPQDFLRALEQYKVNFALLAPPLVSFLAKHPMVAGYDLSHLTTPYSGAAALSKPLTEMFIERLRLTGIRQGYGMTETSPATHTAPLDGWKHGSVGVPLSLTHSKVIDPETGCDLAAGKEGEICVRGPQVMRGYLNNPRATDEAFTANGWLKTGDLGYVDTDGHYFVVDRLKDIIKYKGYQISPANLESILLNHPAVTGAAVVGLPVPGVGEVPRAFVVLHGEVTEKELTTLVADQVSPFKRLRGGVEFVKAIPTSPSGKTMRRVLRDRIMSRQQRGEVWGS